MRPVLALLIAILPVSTPAFADEHAEVLTQGRQMIGAGRLFSNDYFGDGRDRWRTGSFVYSHVRGREAYSGTEGFGDVIEYRYRAEIIAPGGGSKSPGDRPYVGTMSLGAHTHFDMNGTQISAGADVVAIGSQTGLSDFQEQFHDTFDMTPPLFTDQQLGNKFLLNGTVTATRPYQMSDRVSLRPFAEAQIGTEDLVRVGADVLIGSYAHDDLLLRDVVTGQLYNTTAGDTVGLAYLIGADIASVYDSEYLPEDMGYAVSETRARARAGVFLQLGADVSFFYGATYLSEEFEGQTEGQVVGSLKLNFNF